MLKFLVISLLLIASSYGKAAFAQAYPMTDLVEEAHGLREEGKYRKAIKLYVEAAEAGNPEAMNAIGVMAVNGLGMSKNEARGFTYVKDAAEMGYPNAQKNLAEFYEKGIHVKKNKAKADYWYSKYESQIKIEQNVTSSETPIIDDVVIKDTSEIVVVKQESSPARHDAKSQNKNPANNKDEISKLGNKDPEGDILGFSTTMTVKEALSNCKRLGLNFERAGLDQLRCIGRRDYLQEVSMQLRKTDLSDIVIIKISCGVTKSCGADASQISDAIASKGVFVEFNLSSRSLPSKTSDLDVYGRPDPTNLSLLPRSNKFGCATDGVQVLCLGGQSDRLSVGLLEVSSPKQGPSDNKLRGDIVARLGGVLEVKGVDVSLGGFSLRETPRVNFSKAQSLAKLVSRSNSQCQTYDYSLLCGGSNYRELESLSQFIDRRYRTGATDWNAEERLTEVEIFVVPNKGDLTSAGSLWGTREDKITVNGVQRWEDFADNTSAIRIGCKTYGLCKFDHKLVVEALGEIIGVNLESQVLDRRITVINKNGIKTSQSLKGRPSIGGFDSARCGLIGKNAVCYDGQSIWLVENKEYLYDLSEGSTGLNF